MVDLPATTMIMPSSSQRQRFRSFPTSVSVTFFLCLLIPIISSQHTTTTTTVTTAASATGSSAETTTTSTTTTEEVIFDGTTFTGGVHVDLVGGDDTSNNGQGLLDSIWTKFKQSLETARNRGGGSSNGNQAATKTKERIHHRGGNAAGGGSHNSFSSSSTATQSQQQQQEGIVLSAQRIQLLELTLEEHYTRQLVKTSPHLDENLLANNSDDDQQNSSPLQDRPLVWKIANNKKRNNNREGGQQPYCYGFSPNEESYWSFSWCWKEKLGQGRANKIMVTKKNKKKDSSNNNKVGEEEKGEFLEPFITFNEQYSLGQYLVMKSSELRKAKTRDGKFFLSILLKYPDALDYQTFVGGSICYVNENNDTTNNSNNQGRRASIVIIHKYDSTICVEKQKEQHVVQNGFVQEESDIDKTDEHVIIKVEEPQKCKYVIHACKLQPQPHHPSSSSSSLLPTTNIEDSEQQEVTEEAKQQQQQQQQQQDGEVLQSSSSSSTVSNNDITESDVQELEQTMDDIHEIMHSYLHQTQATTSQKANPDRTTALHIGLPPIPMSKVSDNIQLIKDMFRHAYDNYMYKAYPSSDLKPLTCKGSMFGLVKIPALTLIDSLDTLIILGNYTEFARSVERLRFLDSYMAERSIRLATERGKGLFALNQNVSVFETNIRVLGGLLSAHQLAIAFMDGKVLQDDVFDDDGDILIGSNNDDDGDSSGTAGSCKNENEYDLQSCSASSTLYDCSSSQGGSTPCRNQTIKYWEYDGFLLELAQDIGDRLVPAFKTRTGIPYGTVNLLSGIPEDETTVASLAGGGTLSLEMELLSRLTGNREYGRLARRASRALWMRRSPSHLFGKHICTHRGEWRESLSGIGSNSDSFYEYLVKHYLLFPEDHDFWIKALSAYGGIHNESRLGEWYVDVDLTRGISSGGGARKIFEALMAFYPGMQALLGELTPAARSLNSFFLVREHLGFLPERFHYGYWKVDSYGGKHLLRPELLESAYFLHRATKGFLQQPRNHHKFSREASSGWQWAADFALHRLEKVTRTECGYASIDEVSPTLSGEARLTSANSNSQKIRLYDEMPSYFLSETLKYLYLTFDENNILHTDEDREWIFTTEAHPIHAVEETKGSPFETLQQTKQDLINRLKWRIVRSAKIPSTPMSKLEYEIWSPETKYEEYIAQIADVSSQVEPSPSYNKSIEEHQQHHRHQQRQHYGIRSQKRAGLLEPFLVEGQVLAELDFYNETQSGANSAHLSWSKMGNKHLPSRSCANFYSTDLLWIRALNGGFSDYADAYMSAALDYAQPGDTRFLMLGSIDALALHGSGAHVTTLFDTAMKTPIRDSTHRKNSVSDTASTASKKDESTHHLQDGKERFDMGGELGQFDVSAFAGGSGFYIQRVATGESFITTLINDGTENGEESEDAYVMVYGSTPVDSISGDEGESKETTTNQFDRSVIMSNFKGDNFDCQIEILEVVPDNLGGEDGPLPGVVDDKEQVVARFPCAPALFGPTHLSELVRTKGITVEARIQAPIPDDEFGCNKGGGGDEPLPPELEMMPMQVKEKEEISSFIPRGGTTDDSSGEDLSEEETPALEERDNDSEVQEHEEVDSVIASNADETCKNSFVQMVKRGVCTFQEKSLNQQNGFGADAVIVINSDVDELFVMSGGGFDDHVDDSEYPVTVLVTGADGRKLIEGLSREGVSQLVARISLTPDQVEIVEDGQEFSIASNEHWPVLRVNPQVVQLFAKGGWGVHAVRSEQGRGTAMEWQLYVMQHKVP